MLFKNRVDAGQKLATSLSAYAGLSWHLVVGLPRGGVIVAKEVAAFLKLPLEIIVVRKIGTPLNPELAMGALAGDLVFLDQEIVQMVGARKDEIKKIIDVEQQEATRRELVYRENRKLHPFQDQTVLLIDDGIATGATLHVAILLLKQKKVRSIVLAVPVASAEILERFRSQVDLVICLATPANFFAVGQFYLDFKPVTDEEVCKALKSLSQKGF